MSRTKILIVDDEIIIARELEARLLDLGYEVVGIASSGREALELAEQTRPDLVLMDIVLVGQLDGIGTAAEVQNRWAIPVVYVTAYSDDATLERARVTEPYGFIVKPFSERELRANIEMALYKHQAESQLRAVGKWFANSMQQIGDGVIATDARGNISFMNRVAEALTGWQSEEAIGTRLDDVVLFFSGDRISRLDPMTFVAADRELVVDVGGDVFLVGQRSREEVPIYLAATTIEDAAGDPSGVMIVVRDISEQRRAQKLLREIEEQYLQAQKLEAVGLLAGGIAHEFNNLLTVISGYTSLLLRKTQIDPESWEQLRGIEQAGERARQLTSRFLTFSRRQVFESRVVDLNALVINMAKMFRHLIGEDITLTTSLTPDLGRVKVDAGQLEQSLMNLIVNARDAMPGGGSLIIETANVGLEESLDLEHLGVLPGRYVKLTVKDTGHGMSPEVKERVFEPFFTTKGPGSGTGLGLATVYGTVQQSRGYITIESEPGNGSTFAIYLPEVEEEVQESKIDLEPINILSAQETVLLVEDEDLVRACILHLLQSRGYRVLEASGPEEALTICENYEGSIHLLVTDVVMPGMRGDQLAERATELHKGMKVLYISGYPQEMAPIQVDNTPFLQKPFAPERLTRMVREVLDRSG